MKIIYVDYVKRKERNKLEFRKVLDMT